MSKTHVHQKAFTLLEMLIVLAVMGILLAIAGFNTIQWQKSEQLNAAMRDVSTTLSEARALARRTSRNAVFKVVNSSQYNLTSGTLSRTRNLPNGVNFINAANYEVAFQAPYGTLSATNKSFELKFIGESWLAQVNVVGVTGKVVSVR